jgi:tetratricopeptide (TPR) repeat protein
MKYKLIAAVASLCIIIVICASPVFAKVYARVSGSVKTEDGKPIEGARVILIFAADGAKIETATDKKGSWSKVNLRPGAWTMGFMADGYEPQNINVTLHAIKRNPPIDIKLAPVPESPLKKPDDLYQQGKYAEAAREYQKVLSENQELYHVWEQIGLCYYKLNDLENAAKAFKKILEKNPGSREVLINLAAIYLGKGNLEEGMKYFKQLDEETLKDHSIFYNIGVLLFNNNQMDMAIDYFKKCVTRNPNYVEAYFQLALAYLNKGDMEEAKKNLQKIIEIAPGSDKAAQAKDILKSLN